MEFAHYWQYTDLVSKSLFFVLLLLSVVSWIVGISKIIATKKQANTVFDDMVHFIQHKMTNFNDDKLEQKSFEQKKLATEQLLLQKIARIRFDSEKGLAVLGTTAAIAPFIGLFGTVWGIFHALHKIGQTGQAGLAQVAGPVGEALIMTALGLFVAIPAVIFLNVISRLNKKIIHLANDAAHEILAKTVL